MIIVAYQTGGGHEVGVIDRLAHFANVEVVRSERHRIDDDVKLAHFAADDIRLADALNAQQRGPERVHGEIAQLDLAAFLRGEAEAHDRKNRNVHALHLNRDGGGQLVLHRGNAALQKLQRVKNIRAPREIDGNFRRAAAGFGAHDGNAGHAARGFFKRLGGFDHHALDGLLAVVRKNDDARESDLRKQRDGQIERRINARESENGNGEDDGALMPMCERDYMHVCSCAFRH